MGKLDVSVQCGYDTPGLVMQLFSLLVQHTTLTARQVCREHCSELQ